MTDDAFPRVDAIAQEFAAWKNFFSDEAELSAACREITGVHGR